MSLRLSYGSEANASEPQERLKDRFHDESERMCTFLNVCILADGNSENINPNLSGSSPVTPKTPTSMKKESTKKKTPSPVVPRSSRRTQRL